MADITFFEVIFEERFCAFLLTNSRARLEDSDEFRRSNFHWNPAIRKSSAVVLVRDYDDALSKMILAGLINARVLAHDRYRVMNYAWTRFSYIPWHDDDVHSEALTIYLNDLWERDWGGLFLYEDGVGEIRAFSPKFNCGLKNVGNLMHATTPVTLDAPEPRFTLQIFPQDRRPHI